MELRAITRPSPEALQEVAMRRILLGSDHKDQFVAGVVLGEESRKVRLEVLAQPFARNNQRHRRQIISRRHP